MNIYWLSLHDVTVAASFSVESGGMRNARADWRAHSAKMNAKEYMQSLDGQYGERSRERVSCNFRSEDYSTNGS